MAAREDYSLKESGVAAFLAEAFVGNIPQRMEARQDLKADFNSRARGREQTAHPHNTSACLASRSTNNIATMLLSSLELVP